MKERVGFQSHQHYSVSYGVLERRRCCAFYYVPGFVQQERDWQEIGTGNRPIRSVREDNLLLDMF